MDDSAHAEPDRLDALLAAEAHEAAVECLDGLQDGAVEERKAAIRSLRDLADDGETVPGPLVEPLAGYLTDDDRAVRLSTAKLFVSLARNESDSVLPATTTLGARLADESEFYFVRARAAEALGYVAVDHPDAVASPDVLADLTVGLSFDELEVRVELAKALEHVALGDPTRLDHRVGTLAEHLDDDEALVRYHLASALVVVGCAVPGSLDAGREQLVARLDDENRFVRGRAAEALGLRSSADAAAGTDDGVPTADLEALLDDDPFVAERAHFAIPGENGDGDVAGPDGDGIGTIDGVAAETADVAAEIAAPETDGECPHCGLELSETGPRFCPQCGAPY